jgi:23S rRNA pseudouridine1911/1915/1917 synthase
MLVAKHDKAHIKLSKMISSRDVKRHYQALCWGVPHPLQGTIDAPIGRHAQNRVKMTVTKKNSRNAITHYAVQSIFGKQIASLIECRLETGRTHQIRVHLAHILHPVIGDPLYNNRNLKKTNRLPPELQTYLTTFQRQALHAYYLAFDHPITGIPMEFYKDMPEDMQKLLTLLENVPSH